MYFYGSYPFYNRPEYVPMMYPMMMPPMPLQFPVNYELTAQLIENQPTQNHNNSEEKSDELPQEAIEEPIQQRASDVDNGQNLPQRNRLVKRRNVGSTGFQQKQGRNAMSNVFRQFLRYFFQNREASLRQVSKVVQNRNFQMTPKQFSQTLDKRTNSLKTYIRNQEIKNLLKDDSEDERKQEFCQILRIILMIHLKTNQTSAIYYSGKVPKNSRAMHFVAARKLEKLLKNGNEV